MKTNAELTELGQVLFDAGAKSERSRIIQIIESMKKEHTPGLAYQSDIEAGFTIFGWNNALSEIKSKLQEKSYQWNEDMKEENVPCGVKPGPCTIPIDGVCGH